MTSPRISTSVVDIFTRSFVIPNVVSIKFYRQPDGYRYIACIPTKGSNNRPLFVCADGFIKIIDIAAAWLEDKGMLSHGSTSSEISIRGDSVRGHNRIDVVLSSCDNIKTLDVRNYWKPIDCVKFMRTCIGFTVRTSENITALLKIKNELTSHLNDVDILEDIIHIAHGVIYDIYTETCGFPYNAVYREALITISLDEFTSLLYERMSAAESKYAEKWFSATEGLYTYILSKGVESLERYIERTQLESYVL